MVENAAEVLYVETYPYDESAAGVFGGERFDDCERIARLALDAIAPAVEKKLEQRCEQGRADAMSLIKDCVVNS